MERIICFCKGVSESEIESAVIQGAKNLKDIQLATSACTGNTCAELNPKGVCCSEDIIELLKLNNKLERNCCCGK